MWQSLHDAWWRLATQSRPRSVPDALACSALHAGAVAYGTAVSLRNTAYDTGWLRPASLPCPVISIGNVTIGGTGKTACVELITRKLTALRRRVAILSRGYGGPRRAYQLQWERGGLLMNRQDAPSPNDLADEPQLLVRHLKGVPVLVGSNRGRSGALACQEFACDAVVLDDGFQHRQLRRDCDIVLIHARMPLGGWALLPRGPMREPLTALKRAHVVMITKADEAFEMLGALGEKLRALAPEATLVMATHQPAGLCDALTGTPRELHRLAGLRVGLLSSIGDPAGFEATVRRLHATVLWHLAFPDHHRYDAADRVAILGQAQGSRPDAVITTEKDWIRLQRWMGDRAPWTIPLWVLGIRLQILNGEEVLDARLARLCRR